MNLPRKENRLIYFTLILFIAIFASMAYESFGQGSALVRSCAGTGLTTKQAKLEVTKDGDINIIPCDARSVLLRGNVLEGSGTVQSVGLTLPNIFTVTGSPITSSGTIAATLASQSQNLIFGSPNGSSGAPSFRALVAADIPSLDAAKITTGTFSSSAIPSLDVAKITTGTFAASFIPSLDAAKITTGTFSTSQIPSLAASKITSGTIDAARLGSGTADNTTYLRGDGTWQVINNLKPTESSPSSRTLSTSDAGKVISTSTGATFTLSTAAADGTQITFITSAGVTLTTSTAGHLASSVLSTNAALTNATMTVTAIGGYWYITQTSLFSGGSIVIT